MHPQSPSLTIGWTVLKSLMTLLYLEWHLIPKLSLRSIFSWFLKQLLKDLVSWGSPGKSSMINHFSRWFWGFLLPILEYCSAVWCLAAETHLKQLDSAVSGAQFQFECDIAHRRSVAVLCKLYKIRFHSMHQLNDALPGLYVPVRVSHDALVAHRHTYAPPHWRTSQHPRTFGPLWNDLADPYSIVCDWQVSKAGPRLFHWPKLLYPYYSLLLLSLSLLSVYRLVLWGWCLLTDRVYITLSWPCNVDLF